MRAIIALILALLVYYLIMDTGNWWGLIPAALLQIMAGLDFKFKQIN